MIKSAFSILAVTAAAGIALTPVAASAATRPAVLAISHTAIGGDPDTTVTFTVTSAGTLSMTAPASVNLGTGAVGGTITGVLSGVGPDPVPVPTVVTDDRALDAASWTVTASSSDWTTGAGLPVETIPAADVTYAPGTIATTGVITATGTDITLANAAAPPALDPTVVAGTAGIGDNSATWNPTIAVHVPAGAVAGDYTGTLTQSVA
jgi:hypothetical protein